jgi:hypothetical protein
MSPDLIRNYKTGAGLVGVLFILYRMVRLALS